MSGTKIGGQRAAQRNKELYGPDFYKKIGQLGGRRGHTGGFASEWIGADGLSGRERASVAGSIGGTRSRRSFTDEQREEARKRLAKGRDKRWSRFKSVLG